MTAACAPTGSLADPGRPDSTCRAGHPYRCVVCGVPLRLAWRHGDWFTVAGDGSMFAWEALPAGENVYEYLNRLGAQSDPARGNPEAFGAYTMLRAQLVLRGNPYMHRHRAGTGGIGCEQPTAPHPPSPEPPRCCGQPMWLTGDGWQCRASHASVPFTQDVAA